MKIKVFADTICGWCYIGHSRLLKAVKNFENIEFAAACTFSIKSRYAKRRYFSLDYLKHKFGSKELAQPMYDNMSSEAIKDNLKFKLNSIQVTPNTKVF